jgi:hypothetical protein
MRSAGGSRPGRLISLGDIMQSLNMSRLLDACSVASSYRVKDDKDSIYTDVSRNAQALALGRYVLELHPLGLSASCASLKKMKAKFETDGCKRSDIAKLAIEFFERLIDETGDKVFFSLLPREAEYFQSPCRGWEVAIGRFPIRDEVEEASKCFALSRYAAAVFHSVQIVEIGLIELGGFIKVNDPKSGWTAVSKALDAIIKKSHNDRTLFEKKNFGFLEQMQGTVEGLKNAWRNKISHAQGRLVLMTTDFNPEIAEEIVFATRAFIRRLAEGIPAPKKKKGA